MDELRFHARPAAAAKRTTRDGVRGDGNDVLHGDQRSDHLFAGNGGDVLDGGGGDALCGQAGDDVPTGGDGDDVFQFSPRDGRQDDRITDFENGADTLALGGFAGFGDDDPAGLVAAARSGGSGVVIDLEARGGGAILPEGFDAAGPDASDFHVV